MDVDTTTHGGTWNALSLTASNGFQSMSVDFLVRFPIILS